MKGIEIIASNETIQTSTEVQVKQNYVPKSTPSMKFAMTDAIKGSQSQMALQLRQEYARKRGIKLEHNNRSVYLVFKELYSSPTYKDIDGVFIKAFLDETPKYSIIQVRRALIGVRRFLAQKKDNPALVLFDAHTRAFLDKAEPLYQAYLASQSPQKEEEVTEA